MHCNYIYFLFFFQNLFQNFAKTQGVTPQYTEQSQMQQPNAINYGATGHVANNPFAAMSGGTIPEESVMPEQTADASAYGVYDYTQQQQQQQMPSYNQQYPQQAAYQQQQQPNYQQPYQTQ